MVNSPGAVGSSQGLEVNLVNALDEKAKIDHLNQLASDLLRKDLFQAVEISQKAYQLSSQDGLAEHPYLLGQAESMKTLGHASIFLANYSNALEYLIKAQPLFEEIGDSTKLAALYNIIGICYDYFSNYPESLQYYLKALALYEQNQNHIDVGSVLNNIGNTYLNLNEPEKALPFFIKGNQKLDGSGATRFQGAVLDSLCITYLDMGDYDQALFYANQALELTLTLNEPREEINQKISMGRVFLARKDEDQSERWLLEAIHEADQLGFKYEFADAHFQLGSLYIQRGQNSEAGKLFMTALEVYQAIGARREVYRCHQMLAELYKNRQEFELALHHYEQFHEIKEEVFNEAAVLRQKSLEIAHQMEQARKEAEIFQLRNVALQQEIEERIKAQTYAEQLAITDPVTGLFNRRHFFQMGEREFEGSAQSSQPISVIMIDIDDFKIVNDTFGHASGDYILCYLANSIRECVRETDITGRYGGDEFCIILPRTGGLFARQVGERIRLAICSQLVKTGDFSIPVTISLGLADNWTYKEDEIPTFERLLEHADQALYLAKHNGKNCLAIYQCA